MSNPLFAGIGVDIAALVNQHIGDKLVPATLTKYTAGAYDSSDPAAGTNKTSASYTCRVVQTEFIDTVREGDLVRYVKGEVVVILRSVASLKVPGVGDTLSFVGPTGVTRTLTIVGDVDIDAAGATATCEVEG
jgi:hypothetical protein